MDPFSLGHEELDGNVKALVYVVFFLSGVAALVYEISWSRQIGLLFGNTAAAVATALASYFSGLAIGYWLFAGRSQTVQRPLRAYGVLELAAALSALAVPLLLAALRSPALAAWIHQDNPSLQMLIRVLVCLAILLPTTICLGGTLPLMAAWLSRSNFGTAHVAWAYGLNTLGGLAGVLVATIVLLSTVGVVASGCLAAFVSAMCGVATITFGRKWDTFDAAPPPMANHVEVQDRPLRKMWLLALVAITGFGTLALEVLYTRLFSLVFHNSTYNFGMVIAVVLCGLAIGAWIAAWLSSRFDPLACIVWISLAAGVAIAISTRIFEDRTELRYFVGGETFATYMLACLGLVTAIVLPPMLLLGTILPLLWHVARRESMGFSELVGRLTAVNTLAAAGGALAASFLLLPVLGLWSSFACIAAVYVGAAIIAVVERKSHAWGVTIAAPLAMVAIFSVWRTLTQYVTVPSHKTLVARWEGTYGWIDVLSDNRSGSLSLRENINYTHGSTASAEWERRQGHIALLLHPQPRDVLFLGLGTAATASSAKFHEEVQSIHIAELIPQVVKAAEKFEISNAGVLHDPRTQIHIDDARHFLLGSQRRFDVIVSDLFVPWESKTGYLYTVDHFRIAHRRLKPGGHFCQWVALWQLGPQELEMIADSFASVFPHTTIWLGKAEFDRTILALVGSNSPLVFDAQQVDARLARVHAASGDTDQLMPSAQWLARLYVGDWPRREHVALNTDEHPRLEFAMPLTYADQRTLKQRRLLRFYDDVLATLPQQGVVFSAAAGDYASPSVRRDWQRQRISN
jgi:spermidine synthase